MHHRESTPGSEVHLDEDINEASSHLEDHLKDSKKGKHQRVQSAVTTVGLLSSQAPDDSATDYPNKAGRVTKKKQNRHERVESVASSTAPMVLSDKSETKKPEPIATDNGLEDMIQDLYSEDNLEDPMYDSPSEAEEKLNPVIEESHEYSVTPSRVIQTATVSNVVSPQREKTNTTVKRFEPTQPNPVVVSPLESRRQSEDVARIVPRVFNQNEFMLTAAQLQQQTGRASEKIVAHQTERKMQGAQMYRSKRDLSARFNSVDENQFIKKGQEMVHSFGEDDMSRSYISANKGGDKMSVFSNNHLNSTNDPVIIDWNVATNGGEARQMNKANARAQASMHEADDFLSKHVSQLDAVSEVDSQMGATPMNAANDGIKKYSQTQSRFNTEKASTPRDAVENAQRFEPATFMNKQRSQMTVVQDKVKAKETTSFSPLKMLAQPGTCITSQNATFAEEDHDKSVNDDNLRKNF